jgi:hypothetical protein
MFRECPETREQDTRGSVATFLRPALAICFMTPPTCASSSIHNMKHKARKRWRAYLLWMLKNFVSEVLRRFCALQLLKFLASLSIISLRKRCAYLRQPLWSRTCTWAQGAATVPRDEARTTAFSRTGHRHHAFPLSDSQAQNALVGDCFER